MFTIGNSNPLKGLQKRLSSMASTIFSGPSPIKALKNALEAGDEEKAIEVYTFVQIDQKTGSKGISLMDELNPSQPFPSKKTSVTNYQTPLHLAAKMAMYRILTMFLEHNGNPNFVNGRDETCLHCVCSGGDKPLVRKEILEILLKWEGTDTNGVCEVVSVNHVDIDGNIALHYASANGLTACVERLVELNSILSLVNKSQMTCCEMADENNYKDMASMLEVSILFQPNDSGIPDDTNAYSPTSAQLSNSTRQGMLILDSTSMKLSDMYDYMEEIIDKVYTAIIMDNDSSSPTIQSLTRERIEVILNAYSWDYSKVITDFTNNPNQVYSTSKLTIKSEISTTTITSTLNTKNNNQICGICCDTMSASLSDEDIPIAKNDPKFLIDTRRSLVCHSGHQYCLDCWRSHLQVQIKDNGGYCLSCPGFKCQEIVSGGNSWVDVLFYNEENENKKKALPQPVVDTNNGSSSKNVNTDINISSSNPMINRYYEQRARHVIDCCSSMKWCPVVDCGAIVQIPDNISEDRQSLAQSINPLSSSPPLTSSSSSNNNNSYNSNNSTLASPNKTSHSTFSSPTKTKISDPGALPTSVICYNCHTFCLSCGLESHTPCSCEDWKKWQSRVQQEMQTVSTQGSTDEIANALWMAANTKRCPRCQSPIEKDEGCNHMSCRKCRHEFCWICMQDWSLHSNTTGGFFQCNRFVSELMAQNGEDANNATAIGSAAEELGNAHLETIRMKDRGSKMARFISLYTRLKAHNDSVTMERRIYPETMTRIVKSLEATASTKSKSVNNNNQHSNYTNKALNGNISNHSNTQSLSLSSGISSKASSTIDSLTSQKWLWLQKSRVAHPYDIDLFGESSQTSSSSLNSSNLVIRRNRIYPKALHPLHQGFEELIKCRQFLIGCVAYAFTTFANVSDEENVENLMMALARNRMQKYQSTMRLDDHRLSFERLQGDLEMYCEMLSDVVARRRLRAANSQITAIVNLARSKRLELEELIYMFNISEAYEKQNSRHNSGSSAYPDTRNLRYRGSRSHSSDNHHHSNNNNNNSGGGGGGSNSHSRRHTREDASSANALDIMSRFAIGPDGLVFLQDSSIGDDEDDIDITSLANLIQEMERYQQAQIQQQQIQQSNPSSNNISISSNNSNSNNNNNNSNNIIGNNGGSSNKGRSRAAQAGINVAELDDMEILRLIQSDDAYSMPPTPLLPTTTAESLSPRATNTATATLVVTPPNPPQASLVHAAGSSGNTSTGSRISWFRRRSPSSSALPILSATPLRSGEISESDTSSWESISDRSTPTNGSTTVSPRISNYIPVSISSIRNRPHSLHPLDYGDHNSNNSSNNRNHSNTIDDDDDDDDDHVHNHDNNDSEEEELHEENSRNSSYSSNERISPVNIRGRNQQQHHSQQSSSLLSSNTTTTRDHLSQRVEEEAALNHAILLSLHDRSNIGAGLITSTNTTPSVSSGNNESVVADEGNVAILVSMGFPVDQVTQALTRSNNNIDTALNSLIEG